MWVLSNARGREVAVIERIVGEEMATGDVKVELRSRL
jgi:hypothetical protein